MACFEYIQCTEKYNFVTLIQDFFIFSFMKLKVSAMILPNVEIADFYGIYTVLSYVLSIIIPAIF